MTIVRTLRKTLNQTIPHKYDLSLKQSLWFFMFVVARVLNSEPYIYYILSLSTKLIS